MSCVMCISVPSHKVFVDKRTQDKVLLLSGGNQGLPDELSKFVDPSNVPACVGGAYKEELLDLADTFPDRDRDG